MIFDIGNPVRPLGLTSGRVQTRRAWRLTLVLTIKVGNCRSEVHFRGPLLCDGIGSLGNQQAARGTRGNQKELLFKAVA